MAKQIWQEAFVHFANLTKENVLTFRFLYKNLFKILMRLNFSTFYLFLLF